MSRVPRELSEEELLKALEESQDDVGVKTIEYKNDVLSFFSFYNIQNGTDRVNKKLVFKIYREWSDQPLNSHMFMDAANLFLENDRYYFFINQDTISLTVSAYKSIQARKRDMTKSRNYQKHFRTFLDHHDIKTGLIWIPNFVLYYLYDKWTYHNKMKRPMAKSTFLKFLPVFLPKRKRSKEIAYHAVGRGIYKHITKEQVSVMKRTRKVNVKKGKRSQASDPSEES